MRELDIEISEIKNIKKAKVSIPLNRGIYGIIGNNGTGKSTIMTCLAQAVFSHSLDALREEDINEESYVLLSDGEKTAKISLAAEISARNERSFFWAKSTNRPSWRWAHLSAANMEYENVVKMTTFSQNPEPVNALLPSTALEKRRCDVPKNTRRA